MSTNINVKAKKPEVNQQITENQQVRNSCLGRAGLALTLGTITAVAVVALGFLAVAYASTLPLSAVIALGTLGALGATAVVIYIGISGGFTIKAAIAQNKAVASETAYIGKVYGKNKVPLSSINTNKEVNDHDAIAQDLNRKTRITVKKFFGKDVFVSNEGIEEARKVRDKFKTTLNQSGEKNLARVLEYSHQSAGMVSAGVVTKATSEQNLFINLATDAKTGSDITIVPNKKVVVENDLKLETPQNIIVANIKSIFVLDTKTGAMKVDIRKPESDFITRRLATLAVMRMRLVRNYKNADKVSDDQGKEAGKNAGNDHHESQDVSVNAGQGA